MCSDPCCRVESAAASPISLEVGNEQGAAAEARSITAGARRDAYGPPAENHGRTATLWSAYLHARGYPRALSVEDVAWLNCLQKISRDMHAPNPDTLTDVIGYVLNIQEMRA